MGGKSLSEHIERLDVPLRARKDVQKLCTSVFGDEGGRLENVRLQWDVPPPDAGREAEREGWRVFECDVLGMSFSAPQDAPIPMLLAEHYDAEGTYSDVLYRYVHPSLIGNSDLFVEHLVQSLRDQIHESLAALSTSFNLLAALQELETLPRDVSGASRGDAE